LVSSGGIGIELGVAEGVFSERILSTHKLSHLYSVDMYAGDRGHDIQQYSKAVKRLMPYKNNNTILKMTFEEALDLFEDEYFDFIYIDGYAHTGQDDGKTFRDWFPKLKKGGIFSGDDYSPHWPKVIEQVDKFTNSNELDLNIIECSEPNSVWSEHPTWWVRKPIETTKFKNVQDLFNSFPDKVLLVGNGPIENMGDIIDSYECVIRFNLFELNGWEQHVGTKISAISLSSSDFTFQHSTEFEKVYNKYINKVPIFTTSPIWDNSNMNVLHLEKNTKLLDVMPFLNNPETRLTSGCSLALNLALFFNKEVCLIGFDFMKTGHYWDSEHMHHHTHFGNDEFNMLSKIKNIKIL
jgi:hypothetical protein